MTHAVYMKGDPMRAYGDLQYAYQYAQTATPHKHLTLVLGLANLHEGLFHLMKVLGGGKATGVSCYIRKPVVPDPQRVFWART